MIDIKDGDDALCVIAPIADSVLAAPSTPQACEEGSDAYNLDLSRRRADSVAAVLGPAVAGMDLDVTVEGRGEAEPVGDNGSAEGQRLNRRVAIT